MRTLIALVMLCSTAVAQQQIDLEIMSQTFGQCEVARVLLGSEHKQLQKQTETLKRILETTQAEVKALKDKYEPKDPVDAK